MPTYKCPRCHFSTTRRMNFKRHLTRKNICTPIYKDIPVKTIAEVHGLSVPTTDYSKVNTKVNTKGVNTSEHCSKIVNTLETTQNGGNKCKTSSKTSQKVNTMSSVNTVNIVNIVNKHICENLNIIQDVSRWRRL